MTCNRDLAENYIKILEMSQEIFDEFCYDKERNIIVDDFDFFLNYFETFELYLYQKKGRQHDCLLFDPKHF